MSSEDDLYISLEFAPTILKRDIKYFKYHIKSGNLFAYATTPVFLTMRPPYPGESEFDEDVSFVHLSQFLGKELGPICRVEPIITWGDGEVRTDTIKVTYTTAAEPTPTAINDNLNPETGKVTETTDVKPVVDPCGRYQIFPDGSFCWHYGWRFKEDDIKINIEEFKRLEAENSAAAPATNEKDECNLPPSVVSVKNATEQPPQETDKELCDRLKLDGYAKNEIARQLKQAFPTILPSRIGRLITEIPGIHVETDTYRQRGNRMLK